jgi:hypothetical protein
MRNVLLGIVLLLSLTVMAADKIQPLNVKLGLWETTHTTTTSGQMPIPPEMLAKLTPEQRAKMEEYDNYIFCVLKHLRNVAGACRLGDPCDFLVTYVMSQGQLNA